MTALLLTVLFCGAFVTLGVVGACAGMTIAAYRERAAERGRRRGVL